ncbi:unnamed protein product, partial [Timema podura]|nr:unnamed protein product [Timema podura]
YSRLQIKGYPRPSYLFETGSEPLLPLTVGQLIEWAAEEYADKEALVSVNENVRWTFKEAKEKADQLAAGFLALGLNPGDVIALWGFNSSYVYQTSLAAARAGLILAKVDPSSQAPELRHCLNKVGAKLLIAAETDVTQNYYKIVHSLAPELDHCAAGQLRSEQLPELRTVVMTGDLTHPLAPELDHCAAGQLRSEQLPELRTVVMTGDLTHPGTYHFDQIIKMATPEGNTRVKELQSYIQPDDGTTIHYTSEIIDKIEVISPLADDDDYQQSQALEITRQPYKHNFFPICFNPQLLKIHVEVISPTFSGPSKWSGVFGHTGYAYKCNVATLHLLLLQLLVVYTMGLQQCFHLKNLTQKVQSKQSLK